MPSTARKPLYEFEGMAPSLPPYHHPDCDPRRPPLDWELIRYAVKLALAMLTIVGVLAFTALPARSAPFGSRIDEATCDLIRYYVNAYGITRALKWARDNGYKHADVIAALRCLRAKR